MEDVNLNSVYNLITKLCEKIINCQRNGLSNKLIRKCRSKAYEILLSKKIPQQDEIILEDNNDPYCHLLAWQFVLINQYNLSEHAYKLQKCVDILQKSSSLSETVLSDVLYVLLKLCRLPEQNNVISINSATSCTLENVMKFRCFDNTKFKLPIPMICNESKFNNKSFLLQTKKNLKTYDCLRERYSDNDVCKNCQIPMSISCISYNFNFNEDEECEFLSKEEQCDIWELVTKTVFDNHRTWETLGNPHPSREPPFLTEAPSDLCSDLYSMHISNILQLLGEDSYKVSKIIEQKVFISHIKLLLVGIISNSFKRDDKGEMHLVNGVTVEGITPSAMEIYCKDLIFCSCCYSALDYLCSYRFSDREYQCQGFIFKEFCDSIDRYLAYYRVAVQSISENSNLLSVHHYVRPLLSHLDVLASVCKVGPFTESAKQLPSGVALLNYLYQKTVELADKNIIMVLYSILYPCIQVYFNRFIQQWIFEGTVNDPYSEFFIVSNSTYLRTRGRTYWTRSHTICVDIVPDFLRDLSQDILLCGKTMNLLKLCVPNSPLCVYLMGKKPNLLSCCLSSDQISALERNCSSYYLEASADCGPKFQLNDIIMRKFEERIIFLNLITRKRAATLKRLELEKLKKVEQDIERKRKIMAELKKQYDEALQNKKSQLIGEIEREIKSNEEILKIENLRQRLIKDETSNLISYYEKLTAISEKKRTDIQKHIERLKKIDLDLSAPSSRELSKGNPRVSGSASSVEEDRVELTASDKSVEEKSAASLTDTFVSAKSESTSESEPAEIYGRNEDQPKPENDSSTLLDVINANSEGDTKTSRVAEIAAENFEIARRNRARVLSEEMGVTKTETKTALKLKSNDFNANAASLSDLERNRLKVMSSEFDLHLTTNKAVVKREASCCEINRRKIMSVSECFNAQDVSKTKETKNVQNERKSSVKTTSGSKTEETKNVQNEVKSSVKITAEKEPVLESETTFTIRYDDNYKDCNENLENNGNTIDKEENGNDTETDIDEIMKVEKRNALNKMANDNFKPNNLKLDFSKLPNMEQAKPKGSESIFSKFLKSPNFELDRPLPMSLDSTPCVDSATPNMQNSTDESGRTTAATHFTDEGFNFIDVNDNREPSFFTLTRRELQNGELLQRMNISKRVSIGGAKNISTRFIKIFIEQSVLIPVNTQMKLVSDELLKYIFNDLRFLTHLNSLRNYFFLLDGEFGRNITEGLFEKLYDVNFPIDLINCRTLQHLVYNAMDSSIKLQENSSCLSFKINSLPKSFNLEDPDVLECLSLTYKVDWPLNILLPSDTIAKYDEVFKFLLKLNRVAWVLKKILQELKLFLREVGRKETFLLLSPQFQKLHQYRHIMTHFVQTLQNYVVGEVLQTSWDAFEHKLATVGNMDEIYLSHVAYIKNILFMCLLNQRSLPIRKLILKIFMVILKFYNYLRASAWQFDQDDSVYEHPNFNRLENIFRNFEELAAYFVKAARKVAKVGYQPHLVQLLDMLSVNDYYTNRNFPRSHTDNNGSSTLNSTNASLEN